MDRCPTGKSEKAGDGLWGIGNDGESGGYICVIGNDWVLSTYYVPVGTLIRAAWLGRHQYAHFTDEVTEEMEPASMDFLKVEKVWPCQGITSS